MFESARKKSAITARTDERREACLRTSLPHEGPKGHCHREPIMPEREENRSFRVRVEQPALIPERDTPAFGKRTAE